ncbi:MAG: hypothetical protein C4575_12820 [Desulforudis sp.]|nr:MAG: hypothetical protein C4575_12820 [Desulforudis sp.]
MSNKVLQALFVGYGTLEEWLVSANKRKPVFAILITEPGKTTQMGVRTDQLIAMVAQPEDDLVHYCRLAVQELTYISGDPFNPDHQQRQAQAEQAWGIIEDWLVEKGFKVRHGVIAAPLNTRWMDGWAHFLSFDKEKQEYVRKSNQ